MAELRLTDVAEMVHGDWQLLASELGVTSADADDILQRYSYPSEQVGSTATTTAAAKY